MIPVIAAILISDTGQKNKTLNDLVKSVATITKRSSIAVLPTFDKVQVPDDAKEVDDIVTPMRKEGFASLVSDVAVVYQQGIPKSHWGILKGLIQTTDSPASAFQAVTIPQTAIKDNLITFETKGNEAVKLSSLMNLELPKRIMISPYFNFENNTDFPLAISAKDMAAPDFVKALSRGLGGKLVIDNKSYTIAFDAQAFRTNLTKLLALAQQGINAGKQPSAATGQFNGGSYSEYQEYQDATQAPQATTKPALNAALSLLSESIREMNDQLLEQTFAYKGTSTRLNLATFTGLQNSVISYLQAASSASSEQAGADVQRRQRGGGGAPNDLTNLIRRVNPRDPGKLSITTDFRVSLELNLTQNRRRNNNANNPPEAAGEANTVTIQVL